MREYPFPMDRISDFTAWTLPLHGLLLLLALAPFALLFFQSRRLASTRDGCLLLTTMFLAPFLLVPTALAIGSPQAPFIVGYLAFLELACTVTLVVTVYRLTRQKQAVPVFYVLGTLVVFALLIGLMLPAVPSAREAARRISCSNNLKQLGLAMWSYEDVYKAFPAGAAPTEAGHAISWRIQLLPYLEQVDLYDSYDPASAWDSEQNLTLAERPLSPYSCPSNPIAANTAGHFYASYARIYGPNTVMRPGEPTRASDLTAGTANTLGIVEACGASIVWTEPRDMQMSDRTLGINLPGDAPHTSRAIISAYHTGGAQANFMDGSVHFLSERIDPQVLKALVEGRGDSVFQDQ